MNILKFKGRLTAVLISLYTLQLPNTLNAYQGVIPFIKKDNYHYFLFAQMVPGTDNCLTDFGTNESESEKLLLAFINQTRWIFGNFDVLNERYIPETETTSRGFGFNDIVLKQFTLGPLKARKVPSTYGTYPYTFKELKNNYHNKAIQYIQNKIKEAINDKKIIKFQDKTYYFIKVEDQYFTTEMFNQGPLIPEEEERYGFTWTRVFVNMGDQEMYCGDFQDFLKDRETRKFIRVLLGESKEEKEVKEEKKETKAKKAKAKEEKAKAEEKKEEAKEEKAQQKKRRPLPPLSPAILQKRLTGFTIKLQALSSFLK